MTGLALAALLVAAVAVLLAAISDLISFEIPDTLSVVILGAAIAYGIGTPGFDWLSHGASTALFFGIGLFLFSRGWLGGGDIKVMTGCAAWATLAQLPMQMAMIGVAGGGLSLVMVLGRRALVMAGRDPEASSHLFRSDARIPYAVAIAAGMAWWAAAALPLSALLP